MVPDDSHGFSIPRFGKWLSPIEMKSIFLLVPMRLLIRARELCVRTVAIEREQDNR